MGEWLDGMLTLPGLLRKFTFAVTKTNEILQTYLSWNYLIIITFVIGNFVTIVILLLSICVIRILIIIYILL